MFRPVLRRATAVVGTAAIGTGLALGVPSATATAAPIATATYSAGANADLVTLGVDALTFDLADLAIGASTATAGSGTPSSTATADNVRAQVAGLPITVNGISQQAPPDNPTPTASGLNGVDVPLLLDTGLLNGEVQARSAAAGTCLDPGTPLSTSSTDLVGVGGAPGLRVLPSLAGLGSDLVSVAAVNNETSTSLVTTPTAGTRAVQSTSAATIGDIQVLGSNGVTITVDGTPTLTATATGDPATSSAVLDGVDADTVTITLGGTEIPLDVNGFAEIPVNLVALGTGVRANVTVQLGNANDAVNTGTTVSAETAVLTVGVTAQVVVGGAVVSTLADVDLAVAPLSVSASAPADGIQCADPGDVVAPDAPTIAVPAQNATVADLTPTISGTAEPGSTVVITTAGGTQLCTTTAAATTGAFTCDSIALTPGDYAITATATDAAANTSLPSTVRNFTVVAPAGAAPVITAPANGSSTNDPTPTITGTGVDGAEVVVSDGGGTVLCTTTVSGTTFTCDSVALPDGQVTITAVQTPVGGTASPASAPVTFTVDTAAPTAPVITTPTAGSTTTDTTPTIVGTAEAGSTVVVSEGATELCTVTADGSGAFTCDSVVLALGSHTISAVATDAAGNASPASASVTFTVLAPAGDAPVITTPADGALTNSTTVPVTGTGVDGAAVVVSDGDGNELCTATVSGTTFSCTVTLPEGDTTLTAVQTPVNGTTSGPSAPVTVTVDTQVAPPVVLTPADGAVTNDDSPTVTGTGEPGGTVDVVVNGELVCDDAPIDVDGNFTCDVTLPEGDSTIVVTQTDPAGNVSDPTTVTVTVDTQVAPPVVTTPADGAVTNDDSPTVTGTGEPGGTVDVVVNDVLVCDDAPIDADGNFTCDVTLDEGTNTIVVTQTDPAGNVSGPTTVTVTVDTQVAPPVIATPADGSTIEAGTVTFTGTGEPGATVVLSEVDEAGAPLAPLCTTTVDEGGAFTCTTDGALEVREYTVTAVQTDVAGNVSGPSNAVTFTLQLGGTQYVGVDPTRVLETRAEFGGAGGPLPAGGQRTITAAELGLTPGTASAVVLNLTVDAPAADGILTPYPSGSERPNFSTLNYTRGQTVANLAVVPVGPDGGVVVYSSQRSDVVADLFGYFSTTELAPDSGLYHPLTPSRVSDSRLPGGGGPLGANETRAITVAGVGGVPASGVSSVTLNVTVDRPTARGFVAAFPTGTVFPAGQSYPETSNLNFYPGDLRSSRVVVPVGADGQVSFFNLAGRTSLVVDVVGWFSAAGSNDSTGSQFVAVAPTRDLDTRDNLAGQGRFGAGEARAVDLTDAANLPTAGLTAVVTNVTGVLPTRDGFLRVYPPGPLPGTSDVNFRAGQIVPNLTFAGVDGAGRTTIRNEFGQTDVVVDVSGYFTVTPPVIGGPQG